MLRVLCLHGYRQNEKVFREKSGGFRKLIKNKVEFVIFDAPHHVPEGAQNPEGDENVRGWWFSSLEPVDYFHSLQESDLAKGFEETIDLIDAKMKQEGPFDGILGFSQGAALTALILSTKKYDFKFAIFIAGFRSRSSAHDKFYEQKIETPSLHLIGRSDQIIPNAVSEQLTEHFVDPVIVYHTGGHCTPTNSSLKKDLLQFLSPFIDSKNTS